MARPKRYGINAPPNVVTGMFRPVVVGPPGAPTITEARVPLTRPSIIPTNDPVLPGGGTMTTYTPSLPNTLPTFGGRSYYSANPFTDTGVATGPSGGITGAACTVLKSFGFPCSAAGLALAIRAGINVFSGGSSGGGGGQLQNCPSGTVLNTQNGVCEAIGSPGDQSTMGGPTMYTGAVMGIFGAPAVQPIVVGQYGPNPIRKCPRATVLGMDDLCYAKGSIPRKYRKWKPSRRPPVSAADARAIRMAEGAKGRVKRLAGAVGFTVKKR